MTRRTSLCGFAILAAAYAGIGGTQSAIESHTSEVQRLQSAGNWSGLEKVARQALDSAAGNAPPDGADVATADFWLGTALRNQGRYPEAAPPLEAALTIREKLFGPESGDVVNSLNELAATYRDEGQYAKAEPLFQRVLSVLEKVLGPDHLLVASVLNNLAGVYADERAYAKAEPLYQREISIREKAQGPENPDVATSLVHLGVFYDNAGEFTKAEPLYLRALAIQEKVLGPTHANVASNLDNLAVLYREEGQYPKAEPLFLRALSIREKAFGPQHLAVAESLSHLALLYSDEGESARAEPLSQRALGIRERALGAEHPSVADSLDNLAALYREQSQYGRAEPLLQRALLIREKAFGPEHPDIAQSLNDLAFLYHSEGEYSRAEPLYQRALAIREKTLGPEDPDLATSLNNLAALYSDDAEYPKAEPLYQRAHSITEKALGPDHPDTARDLNNLGALYAREERYAAAEPLLERALSIRERVLGPGHPAMARSLNNLAVVYDKEGRYTKAEPLFKRALDIQERTLGRDHPQTAATREGFANHYAAQMRFAQASANFRLACNARSTVLQASHETGDPLQISRSDASECSTRYALSLHAWAIRGGGVGKANLPTALAREGFLAMQRAALSEAADALARSAALTAAKSVGVGDAAEAYEAALRERDQLNQHFAQIAGEAGAEKDALRRTLLQTRDDTTTRIDGLAAGLRKSDTRYWDYRSPEPLDIAALQTGSGADSRLLHEDEALITFLVPAGTRKGVVFAVSKQRFAWAEVGMSGDEIIQAVAQLRAQIDPQAYRLRGFEGNEVQSDRTVRTFDRKVAYGLYQALLGNPSIQAVIRDKPDLLFVPSGALSSLPPGLLITAAPAGGAEKDNDPEALRSTAWLLRAKAVALLPAVSSLRTLRQILPAAHVATVAPLLAFADPDFSHEAGAVAGNRGAEVGGLRDYYRGGLPLEEALEKLPRLPGTRIEAEALKTALGADDGSLLVGSDASKAQLMTRNADGRLAQVQVLEFATHALVAGDASELSEPALVLAAGAHPADELLRASEATTLNLHADWVLLSACNTASPESAGAQGLSGLARAFFFAGAHSLLVSHWRVRDDIAEHLIPRILLSERKDPTLSHAQALRQASLAILDDPTVDAASPSAWAPFTLIGEPGR